MTAPAKLHDRYDPISDFLKWLSENESHAVGDIDAGSGSSFVYLGTVKTYLEENDREKLAEILDVLFQDDGGPDQEELLTHYLAVFCILLQIGKGEYIDHFVDHEIHDQFEFDPEHIPPKFPSVSGDETFYQMFCEAQWRFCVPDFKENMKKIFHPKRTLPIVEKRLLATGGSARIYIIKLHNSYDKLQGHIPGTVRSISVHYCINVADEGIPIESRHLQREYICS
jgi:hypothetical protein